MNAKESLIVSAQALLWELGYVGMSPKAILRHSGVGQGSMYHHFSGKPELAHAAILRSAEGLLARAETLLSVPGTAIDKIVAFLQCERDILKGCQVGRLAQDHEVIKTEPLRQPICQAFESMRRLLADVLAEGVARQELQEDLDVAATADLILSVLQGGYVLARVANSEARFHSAVRGLLAMLRGVARD